MKRLLKVVWALIIGMGLPCIATAQFADAIIPEYSYGVSPIISTYTDNDIQDVAGVTYEVSVTDDQANNCILGWRVGSSIGYVTLGPAPQIAKPSVALVKNASNTVFAIVVYHDPQAMEIYRQTFSWNASQQQFNQQSLVLLSPADVYKTLRIASDDAGFFAVVWDEPGQQIKLAVGQANIGAPAMMNGGQPFPLEPGEQPDVCVFRRASDNLRQLYVSYINIALSISVDIYKYNDLVNGIISPTYLYRTQIPDLMYKNPRIACPGSTYAYTENCTIVTEDTDDNSTWYIKGFHVNPNVGNVYSYHIYNDGSTGNSPWNLSSVPNTHPVVAYSPSAEFVWVAWDLDNSWGLLSTSAAAMAKFPVTMSLFRDAGIFSGSNFLYVPNNVFSFSDITSVSIAGNKSSKVLFTYCNNIGNELISKTANHQYNAPHVRTATNLNEWINLVQQSSSTTKITMTWFDITGRSVSEFSGDLGDLKHMSGISEKNLTNGVYTVRAVASDPLIPEFTGKFLKHNKD